MPSSNGVEILYKGKILGTCTLILAMNPFQEGLVDYELRDLGDTLTNPVGFKPIVDSGAIVLKKIAATNMDAAVDEMLDAVTKRYAALTYQLYAGEITHGTH